ALIFEQDDRERRKRGVVDREDALQRVDELVELDGPAPRRTLVELRDDAETRRLQTQPVVVLSVGRRGSGSRGRGGDGEDRLAFRAHCGSRLVFQLRSKCAPPPSSGRLRRQALVTEITAAAAVAEIL